MQTQNSATSADDRKEIVEDKQIVKFHKKHPYLFFQLIGWGFLIFAFIYMLCNLDGFEYDYQYALFVLPALIGAVNITITPPVIFLQRRNLRDTEKNKWIYELQTRKHMPLEMTMGLSIVFIFIACVLIFLFCGCLYLLPISPFLAAAPYYMYRNIVKKRFFKIPNGEKYCSIHELTKLDEILFLEKTPAIAYLNVEPNAENLNMLFNFYNSCSALKQKEINIYCFEYSLLCKHYGKRFANNRKIFCVSSEDIDINSLSLICFADSAVMYDDLILRLKGTSENLTPSG